MTEEQKMATSYGEIKDKVRKLQLKVLVNFFECAMYQAFGEDWKMQTIVCARDKASKPSFKNNYKSLNEAYNEKKNFSIDDIDITAVTALIVHDFMNECCRNTTFDNNQLKNLIDEIRKNRNSVSHGTMNSDDLEVAREGLNSLSNFVKFLEENNWKYEENEKFREYLQRTDRSIDKNTTFLEEVNKQLLECEAEIKKQIRRIDKKYNKRLNIEFFDEADQEVTGVSFTITTIDQEVAKAKDALSIVLPPDDYQIICSSVPQEYNGFEMKCITIKATDDWDVNKRIIISKKCEKQEQSAGEAALPVEDKAAENNHADKQSCLENESSDGEEVNLSTFVYRLNNCLKKYGKPVNAREILDKLIEQDFLYRKNGRSYISDKGKAAGIFYKDAFNKAGNLYKGTFYNKKIQATILNQIEELTEKDKDDILNFKKQ